MTVPSAAASPALAFPVALAPAARRIAAWLAPGEIRPPIGCFTVTLRDKPVTIPGRVYYQPMRLMAATGADGIDGRIALCLGTRHHDGFMREQCLDRLLAPGQDPIVQDWVMPFVVQLAGEYVVEIVRVIENALPQLDHLAYGRFLLDNGPFLATTERRVISYQYAYREAGYRKRDENPGRRVIAAFKQMRDMASRDLPA